MGLYANAELMGWFKDEYVKQYNTLPDMGKSCVRFKKADQIPLALIAALSGKMSVSDWIETYELNYKK
jgi:hypothetical protein